MAFLEIQAKVNTETQFPDSVYKINSITKTNYCSDYVTFVKKRMFIGSLVTL